MVGVVTFDLRILCARRSPGHSVSFFCRPTFRSSRRAALARGTGCDQSGGACGRRCRCNGALYVATEPRACVAVVGLHVSGCRRRRDPVGGGALGARRWKIGHGFRLAGSANHCQDGRCWCVLLDCTSGSDGEPFFLPSDACCLGEHRRGACDGVDEGRRQGVRAPASRTGDPQNGLALCINGRGDCRIERSGQTAGCTRRWSPAGGLLCVGLSHLRSACDAGGRFGGGDASAVGRRVCPRRAGWPASFVHHYVPGCGMHRLCACRWTALCAEDISSRKFRILSGRVVLDARPGMAGSGDSAASDRHDSAARDRQAFGTHLARLRRAGSPSVCIDGCVSLVGTAGGCLDVHRCGGRGRDDRHGRVCRDRAARGGK